MKLPLSKTRGWSLALIFTLLNGLLVKLYPNDIPIRDIAVWAVVLVLLIYLVNLEWKGYPVLRVSLAEFHKKGRSLEILVATGTLLVPWFILLTGFAVPKNTGFLLAPHLFVLQAHIAGECIIETGGDKDWFMFVYTCLANAYRIVPLTLWVQRLLLVVQDDAEMVHWSYGGVILVLLPAYATFLWLYWSFWYIPFVWYPLLENRAKES